MAAELRSIIASLDLERHLHGRGHARLAGLDRRRRRARLGHHRLEAWLDRHRTPVRRRGHDALQADAEAARDAVRLRARVGAGLLERRAQELVLLREGELEAADAVRAGADRGVDHRTDSVDRRVGDAYLTVRDVAGDARLARLARARGLVARLDRIARRRDRAARAGERLHRRDHRRASLRVLRRRVARARCRRLDCEGELRAIRRGAHLALPVDDDGAPLGWPLLSDRESGHEERETERAYGHARPVAGPRRAVKLRRSRSRDARRARISRVKNPVAAPAGRRATRRSMTVLLPIPGRPVMRRFSVAATIAPGPGWDAVRERLAGDTVMVIGAADRGKSHFARWLVAGSPQPAALLSADVGQPSLGPPACLAVAPRRPWRAPDRLWFVGDVTPVRHLLAIVTGAARLAARARSVGAARIVIDSSGLVDGPLGRVLKYHKAIAAGVTDV